MTCKHPECADVLGHRHAEDYAAIWDYNAQPKEWVEHCNLCGGDRDAFELVSRMDRRYGYDALVVQCPCGLCFLGERMTREAYARFYETGAYRALVSAFHGREINAQTIQPEQREYGKRLARLLKPWNSDGLRAHLDIGASTGVVAAILGQWLGMSSTLLDPCARELGEATNPDVDAWAAEAGAVETIHCLLEDYDAKDDRFDLITLCQTADHLLDLMGSLKKIKGLLSADGLFWSDIVDFDVTREVKIDHPFNLTERTYRMFLEKAGFKLLQINYAPDGKHIGFLAR